ncbi:hypothetical protein [Fulvivirga sp.]|uniref:hypothetical protein n=1 Tax=Fulvivirga sp. TaxID=1931237 RepID=UPI0032EFF98E
MKQQITTLAVAILFFLCAGSTQAQDEGFLYGKVTTIDGKSFTGALRWGKEEAYWTDMFNASKERNNNLNYLSREEMDDLEEHYRRRNGNSYHWGEFLNIRWSNDDYDNKHQHQFVCQFGEIKVIRPTGRQRAEIMLQNGQKFDVDGEGYNDVASDVKVIDAEIGEIKLDWSRIETVEFSDAPAKIANKFGEPLYGTVETYGGTFTGFIQWDHDERVSTDKLDGDSEDGDVSIEFGNLKSIERDGFRSRVVLNSGRAMDLRGSNDVNSENRGIIVTNDKIGRVDIPWREFKKVTFSKVAEKPKAYSSFKSQKELNASVKTTSGETLSGKIIFDLDEEYDYEVLQGKDDDIEYIIPFKYISKIVPRNYDNSDVTLKNGEKIMLGEGQDVSDMNTGVLVFKDKNRPIYIMWKDIEEISFN